MVEALQAWAGDTLMREQYLDFVKCRRFRQTLLCRGHLRPVHDVKPGMMRRLLIASQATPASPNPDLSAGAVEGFGRPGGPALRLDHPLAKAALLELRAAWPRALAFGDLLKAARGRLGRPRTDDYDVEAEGVAEAVLGCFGVGLAELHLRQPAPAPPGVRPVLSPVVRRQLTLGAQVVTGLRHTCTLIDQPLMREMLLLLDGSRDARAVAAELGRRIDAGEVPLPAGVARDDLPAEVELGIREADGNSLLLA